MNGINGSNLDDFEDDDYEDSDEMAMSETGNRLGGLPIRTTDDLRYQSEFCMYIIYSTNKQTNTKTKTHSLSLSLLLSLYHYYFYHPLKRTEQHI